MVGVKGLSTGSPVYPGVVLRQLLVRDSYSSTTLKNAICLTNHTFLNLDVFEYNTIRTVKPITICLTCTCKLTKSWRRRRRMFLECFMNADPDDRACIGQELGHSLREGAIMKLQKIPANLTCPHSSVGRALGTETGGLGFDSRAGQPNNY